MEHYEIAGLLGSGSFAKVYLARDARRPRHRRVALKLVDVEPCRRTAAGDDHADGGCEPSDDLDALLRREADVHASVSAARHPNVVRLLETFRYVDSAGGEVFALAMEHCSRGDVRGYMRGVRDRRLGDSSGTKLPGSVLRGGTFLPAGEIRDATSQVLAGLSFLHSRGVCHRDVKASNVFLCPQGDGHVGRGYGDRDDEKSPFTLSDCRIKLGDFGLAVRFGDDEDWAEAAGSFCGTPSCVAPEVCTRNRQQRGDDRGSGGGYGQPADLWSLGCLLYTMVAGRGPFAMPTASGDRSGRVRDAQQSDPLERSRRVRRIIERVTSGDWELPGGVEVCGPLDALLNQLLDERPSKRGTARGLLNSHPFFQEKPPGSRKELRDKENVENAHDEGNMLRDLSEEKMLRDLGASNQRVREFRPTSLGTSPCRGIETCRPLQGLDRLPLRRVGWERETFEFAVFFLGARGVVVHRETSGDGTGLWMQVTADGATVLSGKLERPAPSRGSGAVEAEAFSRSPAEITSRSFLSMKAFGRDDVLSTYKSLEKAVYIVQAHTPKVSLSIFSESRTSFDHQTSTPHAANRTGGEAGLATVAKAMLMQNGPLADLEIAFVDGKIIRFSTSNGIVCVRSNDSPPDEFGVDPARFYGELRKEPSQSSLVALLEQKWPSLSNYTVVFVNACRECLRIEAEASQDAMHPILKTVVLPI